LGQVHRTVSTPEAWLSKYDDALLNFWEVEWGVTTLQSRVQFSECGVVQGVNVLFHDLRSVQYFRFGRLLARVGWSLSENPSVEATCDALLARFDVVAGLLVHDLPAPLRKQVLPDSRRAR